MKIAFSGKVTAVLMLSDESYNSKISFKTSEYNTETFYVPAKLELGQPVEIVVHDEATSPEDVLIAAGVTV